jgi:hypothetical protein
MGATSKKKMVHLLAALSDFVCLIFHRMLYHDLVRDKLVTNLTEDDEVIGKAVPVLN